MSRRALVSVLVACVALSACGSSGDPSGSAAKEPATTQQSSDAATSTGGEQPALQWEPVDGASLYSVVVADEEGVAYWGWQGSDTTVTVGDGAPDPLVSSEMTWSVVAFDETGDPLWESGPLPI